jgi:putative transposase
MTSEPVTYPGYRFPADVIRHAVWLYHLFSLSFRDVELILAERGISVSHESIRQWCLTFGCEFACKLRRRRPKPGDTWHLDEVFLKINGELHYLWRAVDQHGVVLDILVQDRRNATAAKRFFKRLLAGLQYKPKRLVTDGLRSYGVAQREVLPEVEHRTSRYLNNRAGNSHRPTRRRERQMQRFKSLAQAQRFLFIPRHDLRPLPSAATPDDRCAVPACPCRSLPGVAAGDARPNGGVRTRTAVRRFRVRFGPTT